MNWKRQQRASNLLQPINSHHPHCYHHIIKPPNNNHHFLPLYFQRSSSIYSSAYWCFAFRWSCISDPLSRWPQLGPWPAETGSAVVIQLWPSQTFEVFPTAVHCTVAKIYRVTLDSCVALFWSTNAVMLFTRKTFDFLRATVSSYFFDSKWKYCCCFNLMAIDLHPLLFWAALLTVLLPLLLLQHEPGHPCLQSGSASCTAGHSDLTEMQCESKPKTWARQDT